MHDAGIGQAVDVGVVQRAVVGEVVLAAGRQRTTGDQRVGPPHPGGHAVALHGDAALEVAADLAGVAPSHTLLDQLVDGELVHGAGVVVEGSVGGGDRERGG